MSSYFRNAALIVAMCLLVSSTARAQAKLDDQQRALLATLEKQIIYFPRAYQPDAIDGFINRGGKRIDYQTGQGKQTAWLITPANGAKVETLWLFCGGNAALAMEFEPLCRELPFKSDAYLMIDYPGYGECAGSPSPEAIRENMEKSVLAAGGEVKIDPKKEPRRICVFGHSLGCSAALMAVEVFHLRSAVLCAPFTSTMEVAHEKFGLPKDFPFQHKFDNRPGLTELQTNHGHAWIFHGDADEVLPFAMSKALAEEFKDTVRLTILPGAGHNDVLDAAGKSLIAAMAEARK